MLYDIQTVYVVLTFQGMFAFQHLQASLRCCRIVRALFCLMPSGIMSRMSCITLARSSRSKWLSTRCLVTVLATPFEWRPSNCRERRLPSHRSRSGTTPLRKKIQILQPGVQIPTPGPLPTGPCRKRKRVREIEIIWHVLYIFHKTLEMKYPSAHSVESVVDDMLEIFAHSDLPHQLVLVSVHSRQLSNVSKCVLQSIRQLKCIHVAKTILDMRVDYQLRQTQDLSTKMEGVSESWLLSLLSGERFDWLEVEVVVKMEVVEVLSMDEQVEHVVALTTHLETNFDPV